MAQESRPSSPDSLSDPLDELKQLIFFGQTFLSPEQKSTWTEARRYREAARLWLSQNANDRPEFLTRFELAWRKGFDPYAYPVDGITVTKPLDLDDNDAICCPVISELEETLLVLREALVSHAHRTGTALPTPPPASDLRSIEIAASRPERTIADQLADPRDRSAAVNKFIEEWLRQGVRVTRSDIWRMAGYEEATEFERWQRRDERESDTANAKITAVMTMESNRFSELLKQRRTKKK